MEEDNCIINIIEIININYDYFHFFLIKVIILPQTYYYDIYFDP